MDSSSVAAPFSSPPCTFQFIHQLGHSEQEDQRELAFIMLLELGDVLGKGMEGSLQSLKQFYMQALQDPSRKVYMTSS
jgi:hypothetical protein